MRPVPVDPVIVELWVDRRPFFAAETVCGEFGRILTIGREAACDILDRTPHPLRMVPRVVVDGPSARLVSTCGRLGLGAASIGDGSTHRIVLAPCLADGSAGYLAALVAAECQADLLRHLLAEGDGVVRVLSFPPARLAGDCEPTAFHPPEGDLR